MKHKSNGDMELANILIIRLSAMGDIILTSFAIRCLKKRFPNARITMLTKRPYLTLARAIPHVDAVIGFDVLRGKKELRDVVRHVRGASFDGLVDLQASPRSRWIAWQSRIPHRLYYRPGRWQRFKLVHFRRQFHAPVVPVPLRYVNAMGAWRVEDDGGGAALEVSTKDQVLVRRKLPDDRPVVCLSPGAGRFTKVWPWDRYAELGEAFIRLGHRVVLLGGETDLEICGRIQARLGGLCTNCCAAFSIVQTAAMIRQSALLITNDTGVMHLAGAVGAPHVAIFGPTTEPLGFFPFRAKSSVVEERDLACRPCSYHGTSACPQGHFRCMLKVDVGRVIAAAGPLLNTKPFERFAP